MSEPFLAEVRLVGFTFAPRGNALCDGQILPINQNQSLFSLLGTTYGGDGRTTFALPDLRGRTPVHPGDAGGLNVALGTKTGQERHTLLTGEMPQHTHALRASNSPADNATPGSANVVANSDIPAYRSATGANLANMNSEMIQNVGGNQSHDNMMPWLAINYVIALQGLFPSRN